MDLRLRVALIGSHTTPISPYPIARIPFQRNSSIYDGSCGSYSSTSNNSPNWQISTKRGASPTVERRAPWMKPKWNGIIRYCSRGKDGNHASCVPQPTQCEAYVDFDIARSARDLVGVGVVCHKQDKERSKPWVDVDPFQKAQQSPRWYDSCYDTCGSTCRKKYVRLTMRAP